MLDQRPQTPETIVIRSLAHAVKQLNAVTTLTRIKKNNPSLPLCLWLRCDATRISKTAWNFWHARHVLARRLGQRIGSGVRLPPSLPLLAGIWFITGAVKAIFFLCDPLHIRKYTHSTKIYGIKLVLCIF